MERRFSYKADGTMTDAEDWVDHNESDWDIVSTPKKPKDKGLTVED
jgi:hypothetical protein